jgi:NAD-dependent SIR2 family protein deacetylase
MTTGFSSIRFPASCASRGVLYGPDTGIERLTHFLADHPRVLVLTGAGFSTGSGIPDYRDGQGQWKRSPPMTWQRFCGRLEERKRYWSRSMAGWPIFAQAPANAAHQALARMQQGGWVGPIVTQNVDGLHQAAGSSAVIDLHGRLDRVVCAQCGERFARAAFQQRLARVNPGWQASAQRLAPDGDAEIGEQDLSRFEVPDCARCGGFIRPEVVFFGETVPRDRVALAFEWLEQSDALLVAGSSLAVHSGFRFARRAAELGRPVVAVNQGVTRADDLIQWRIEAALEQVLPGVCERLESIRLGLPVHKQQPA